jgi:outer membrane protein OmpA-like peptidoglycan-associated protein
VHRLSARDEVTTIQPLSSPPTSALQVVTILFLPASARIGPAGQARLVAAPVQGAARLTVRGHADPTGNAASNLRLARSRAQAVAVQLRAVHPPLRHVRIDVVADGKCCGQAGQGSDATHARQRSVEIVIERQEPDP